MSPLHRDHSADAATAAMNALPNADTGAPQGPAAGYRPTATLPIRVEWARQWRRRRTQVALAFMAALPLILAGAFALGSDDTTTGPQTFIDLAQSSAANFVMVTMFFSASFLLIVVVALFFGDTLAAEASWSSLKYLLAIPVSRLRLLRQKLMVAAMLSVASVVILAVVAEFVGLLLYGNGAMVTPTGATFAGWAAHWRMLAAVGFITVQLAWVAGVALLMTVATTVPLGAVGTAVMISILSQILDQISALGGLRQYLPTHFAAAWTDVLASPVDWSAMTRGALSSLVYAAVFGVVAFALFRRQDITS